MRLSGAPLTIASAVAGLLAITVVAIVPATATSAAVPAGDPSAGAGVSPRGQLLSVTAVSDLTPAQVAAALAEVPFEGARVRYGVRAYRIEYRTVGVRAEPTTASALVALPVQRRGAARTVIWEHGTRVGRSDVASVSADNVDRPASLLFAAGGFVTVAPDYLGLGTGPGAHPYAHLASEVTASMDALLAGRELARRQRQALSKDVLVSGFSQGGPAAMALGRAVAGTPGLRLGALAPISGVYDLAGTELPALFDGRVAPPIGAFYLAYWTLSSNAVYGLYGSTAEVFRPPYDRTLPPLFDGRHDATEIFSALPASPEDLVTDQFRARLVHPVGELGRAVAENSTSCQWHPRVPVRLYAAAGDYEVPIANTDRCVAQLRARDAAVEVVELGDVEHLQTPVAALPDVVDWFRQQR